MKRMPFERPTEHYDERVFDIDERLCALIKQRKEISDNNPGFPPFEYISRWASSFELYEDFLKAIFGTLTSENHFRPTVEPTGFRKHLPVLKSIAIDECFYSITSIRQYANASVLNLNIDRDTTIVLPGDRTQRSHFELFIGEQYDCRYTSGGGSGEHFSHKFVVSPPLPDDISGLELVFREYRNRNEPTGLEIKMQLED